MPVSLGLSITQNSQNSAAKTTNVTVALTIYWTGSSYNGYSKPGTVTIDGTPYDFTASFNYANGSGPVSASGNVVAFTKTLNIPHDSDGTKTLYCTATYESGVSSGTVTTSNSKVLTPFSSGGSAGGDSGDDSGGGSGGFGELGTEDNPIGGSGASAQIDEWVILDSSTIYDDRVALEYVAVAPTGLVSFTMPSSGRIYIRNGTTVRVYATVADGYEITSAVVDNATMADVPLNGLVESGYDEFVVEQYATITVRAQTITDCTIKISKGEHTGLVVRRNDTSATLSNGDTVPVGTAIGLVFYADAGYELSVMLNGEPIDTSYGNWVFIANNHTTITTTATKIENDSYPVNIDTRSEFAPYEIDIDNSSGWDKYAAHIDDGTSWHLYS